MKKSFKNLTLMIFIVLLILFPVLKYAIQKPGKGDIESLNSPFVKSNEPEKDNNTNKISKPRNKGIKTTPKYKKAGPVPIKKQNLSLEKNISPNLQNNSNGHPVISDPENLDLQSSANETDLEEIEIEQNQDREMNKIRKLLKNPSSSQKNSKDKFPFSILKQTDSKIPKKLSIIKNKNDSNEDQIKKTTKNQPNENQNDGIFTFSQRTNRLNLYINELDTDLDQIKINSGSRKPPRKKPQIRKLHPYEEILKKKPTDAEKIVWVIKKKTKKRKGYSPVYYKSAMATIAEVQDDDDDVIKLETEETVKTEETIKTEETRKTEENVKTEETVDPKKRIDTSGFSEFRYKIDRCLNNVWHLMREFNEKEQFSRIYKKLYEEKFKNGIQSVPNKDGGKEGLKVGETTGHSPSKNVEKYKNEKRPLIRNNNNRIFNNNILLANNNSQEPPPPSTVNNETLSWSTDNNPFDKNGLKHNTLKNMETFKKNFTNEHWFIRFIEICYNFHLKHMAKSYFKLAQEYSEDTSEDFLNWAWRNYLNNFENRKNRYSPNEVAPFISMLNALNHHIQDSNKPHFTNAYRKYLEKNVLDSKYDQNEIQKPIRQEPYYGIIEMLNAMDGIKLLEPKKLKRTNSKETGIIISNSSTGNTTDVSDYDLGLFG